LLSELPSDFDLTVDDATDGEVKTGRLACRGCGDTVPIRSFIPRFVADDDYADAFAVEWAAFRTAHLDSFTGLGHLGAELRPLDIDVRRNTSLGSAAACSTLEPPPANSSR
jgi:uncharacterized protein YbaR (Trm112 family)